MDTIQEEVDIALKLANRNTERYDKYCNIYPWSNENLGGVFESLYKANSKTLTVCSSGDHVLNAILYGCKDITAFDINKFTFYYLDLKMAAIESFSLQDFLKFMPGVLNDNEYIEELYKRGRIKTSKYKDIMSQIGGIDANDKRKKKKYRQELFLSKEFLENLKNISKQSYAFWTRLYSKNHNITESFLFKNHSCGSKSNIIFSSNYLKSEEKYQIVKNRLSSTKIKTEWTDIKMLGRINAKEKFDFIHLSNIADDARNIFPILSRCSGNGFTSYSKFLEKEIYPLLTSEGVIILNRIQKVNNDLGSSFRDLEMQLAFENSSIQTLDLESENSRERVYYKTKY